LTQYSDSILFLDIEVTITEEQRSTREGSKYVSNLLVPIFLVMLLLQEFCICSISNCTGIAQLSCRIEVSTTSTEVV
jgi:hypothetical protein